jgi:hypothetical protein
MDGDKKQYLNLISEIINKESVILGPEIAILKAKRVSSLIFDANGNLVDVSGYGADAIQELVAQYIKISGAVANKIIGKILAENNKAL